ncbi:MAG: LysR family transcriptional regulator [Pseudomonadales bacterium]
MNWNLAQLQAFVATVQQGSFSAAARELKRAQSQVSTAVANLEVDIGFELFDRSGRYPVLSARGERLYPQAVNLLRQCQQLDGRISSLAKNAEGEFTLAIDEAFPEQTLDSTIRQIERKFPQFRLTLINGSQGDIVNYVRTAQADLGLLVQNTPVDEALEAINIGHLDYAMVTAQSHPLAQMETVSLSDLQQHRQYVSCNKRGEPYNRPISADTWLLDSYFYILPLLLGGRGWAMLPQTIVEHPMGEAQLRTLKVREFGAPSTSTISIIRRHNSPRGEVSSWLIDYLQAQF